MFHITPSDVIDANGLSEKLANSDSTYVIAIFASDRQQCDGILNAVRASGRHSMISRLLPYIGYPFYVTIEAYKNDRVVVDWIYLDSLYDFKLFHQSINRPVLSYRFEAVCTESARDERITQPINIEALQNKSVCPKCGHRGDLLLYTFYCSNSDCMNYRD